MARSFLIVDDDERFAFLLQNQLKKHAQCVVSTNGKNALLLFEQRLRDNTPFTAVFMDIGMPTMSGHEVVQQMRTIEEAYGVQPAREFKLIMISALKDVKNVTMSFFKDGADAFVPKDCLPSGLDRGLSEARLI